MLSLVNSVDDVEAILIPFLECILTDETNRPVYRPLRDKVLFAIYNVPGFMTILEENGIASSLDASSATHLCLFLRYLTKAFLEPRESDLVLAWQKSCAIEETLPKLVFSASF